MRAFITISIYSMSQAGSDSSPQSSRFTKTELQRLLTLSGVYMARMLGLFMILPVFAIYAQGLESVTPLLVGLAMGIYGLAQASLQIPLGLLSDHIGRKTVIIGGLIVFALGSVLAGSSDNIYWIIAGRFLQGSGAIASAIMALVSDVTRNEIRTKAMAIIGASIGFAFLLALMIGPAFYASIGMQGIFYFTACLALLAIALVAVFIPQKIEQLSPTLPVEKVSLKMLLKDGRLLSLDIGVFALHWILTASFIVIPLLMLNEYKLEIEQHTWFYAGVFVASFIMMWPLLKYVDKFSTGFSLFVIGLLMIVQLLLCAIEVNLIGFVILLVLFFVAFNSLEASMPSLLSRLINPSHRGAAMGIYSSSQFLGAFAGGVVGGWLYQSYGWQSVFLVNAVLCGIWIVVNVLNTRVQSSTV